MGKISNYARVLVAKLQDVLVIDTTDSNVTTTKSVTVEQIGDTIAGTQVHSALKTDNQTIIGGINELAKAKNIADEYDDTHTYNTGDVTIYGNTLYICQDDNVTGDFDPSKWTATTIDNVVGSLSTLTTTDKSSLVGAVNEIDGKITTATTKTSGTISAGTGCVVRLGSLTKINGVVFGSFSINMTTPISSRTTIGSIPVGFRPYANVSYLAPSSSAINYFQDRITNVIITTSGDIIAGDIFYPSGQTIKEITLAFSYNQGN